MSADVSWSGEGGDIPSRAQLTPLSALRMTPLPDPGDIVSGKPPATRIVPLGVIVRLPSPYTCDASFVMHGMTFDGWLSVRPFEPCSTPERDGSQPAGRLVAPTVATALLLVTPGHRRRPVKNI